jgi:hypothetical protein
MPERCQGAQGSPQHVINIFLCLGGEIFFDGPLLDCFLALGIRYTAIGSPGVLVIKHHVVPKPLQRLLLRLKAGIDQVTEGGKLLRPQRSLFRLSFEDRRTSG